MPDNQYNTDQYIKQWKSRGSTSPHSWTVCAALFLFQTLASSFLFAPCLVLTYCFLPTASGCQFRVTDLKMGEKQPNGTKTEERGIAGYPDLQRSAQMEVPQAADISW